MLIPIIGVLLAIRYTKGKHILWKIMASTGSVVLVIACLISLHFAMVRHDEKTDHGVGSSDHFQEPVILIMIHKDHGVAYYPVMASMPQWD